MGLGTSTRTTLVDCLVKSGAARSHCPARDDEKAIECISLSDLIRSSDVSVSACITYPQSTGERLRHVSTGNSG